MRIEVLTLAVFFIIHLIQTSESCPGASKINSINYRGGLHFVCLIKPAPDGRPRLEVSGYPNKILFSQELNDLAVTQMETFVDVNGWLRILLAVPDRQNGTSMYSLDQLGQPVDELHTINTQYVSAMAIWKLDLNHEWQLAIANQPSYEPYTSLGGVYYEPKPMISIHSWRSTYFDSYQIIELPESDGRVSKIEPVHINGQEFLVVAIEPERQHQVEPSTNSLIYKLDFGDGLLNWLLFQTLDLRTTLDAKSFSLTHNGSLQGDYYVAFLGQHVSGPYGIIIYKYFGDKFVKTIILPSANATKLDAISYGRGDTYVVIATLSEITHRIEIFLFDGLEAKMLPSPIAQPRQPGLHLFITPAVTNKREVKEPFEMPALALGDGTSIHQIETQSGYSKRDQVAESGENLLAWCKTIINQIAGDNFDAASKQVIALPRIDQIKPIEIHQDLIIEDDLHVENLLLAKNVVAQGQAMTSHQANFSTTFAQIQQVHNEIDRLKQQVDQILVDDGSDQEVFNSLTFDTVVVECLTPNFDPRYLHMTPNGALCPRVDELRTNFINARNVSGIQQQALIAGRAMTITSDVRFEHLVLRGTTEIRGLLNDLPIAEIVFKRGPSLGPVMGHKHFVQGLYSASRLQVSRWDNTVVDRRTHLTTTGEQRIEAPLGFKQVVLEQSSRFERINGRHLDSHLNQIAQQSDGNDFDTPIHFEELILNGPISFHRGSRLSGIDLENQLRNTMFKGLNQNISAPIEMAGDVHVSYGGDIVVNGLVNGLNFNPSTIMMRNSDQVIKNRVIFDGDVIIHNNLHLELALNGIQVTWNPVSRQKELAIMYNQGNQLITGDKIFTNIELGGRSFLGGHINGHLNLSQLYALVDGNDGRPYRFNNIHLTGKNIGLDDRAQMHIGVAVNNVPVNNICNLAKSLIGSSVAQYNLLRFDQPIYFKSLRCASLNGFNDLSRAFLTRHGNQHVLGSLRLTNGLVLNTSLTIQQTFNEMNVGPMAMAIAKTVNETRTGHKDVYGDLVLEELFTERLNDLRLSDILVTKSETPLFIKAPMTFDHLNIENVLNLNGNLFTRTFNDIDINDLLTNTLQYDREQTIYNHVILNNMQLLPGSNLLTKSLNGYDLQRLYADSVLIDVPQQILGAKIFRGSVDFTNKIFMRYGIDELSEQELRFNLLLQSNELIAGDLEFNNDIYVKQELDIKSGIINDIDLKQFVDTMLYENRPDQRGMRIFGNGSVRFKDVQVNNLVVAGTIQGIDLSREAIERPNGTLNQPLPQPLKSTTALPPYTYGTIIQSPRIVQQNLQPWRQNYSWPQNYSQPREFSQPRQFSLPLHSLQQQQHQHLQPQQIYWQHQYVQPALQQPFYQLVAPRPTSMTNQTVVTWKPIWNQVLVVPPSDPNLSFFNGTKYQEYKIMMNAEAIKNLASRVNRYLSISFYYEIFQTHEGPLLHAASNPVTDQGSALLLLKGTSHQGEPVLKRGQSVAVVGWSSQKRDGFLNLPPKTMFSQMSLIEETSDPSLVDSLVIGGTDHYLFIVDSVGPINTQSQVLIYRWDFQSGRYEGVDKFFIDGFPSRSKTFAYDGLGCIALIDAYVSYGNVIVNAPDIWCQTAPRSRFTQRNIVRLANVIDLDVVVLTRGQILIATLSRDRTSQVGDLILSSYDFATRILANVTTRRMVRPLRLHFVRDSEIRLVVTEGITSNDAAQSLTRVFTLRPSAPSRMEETQIIRDNQFHDIQSIKWRGNSTLLFLQSAHSISIFAPTCGNQYSILHRLPTKGANKFAVFNDRGSYGHFLILSDHQSILVLKSRE